MTDAVVDPVTWVPRLGELDAPTERVALIRGLFQLAAWVADHPEVAVPMVQAKILSGTASDGWEDNCRVVDQVAEALGATPEFGADGHYYAVETMFGPVEVASSAITAAHRAAVEVCHSYLGSVIPDAAQTTTEQEQDVAGGAR